MTMKIKQRQRDNIVYSMTASIVNIHAHTKYAKYKYHLEEDFSVWKDYKWYYFILYTFCISQAS